MNKLKLLLEDISGDLSRYVNPDSDASDEDIVAQYPGETKDTLKDIANDIRIINNKLSSGTLRNLQNLVVNDEDFVRKNRILEFLKKYYKRSEFEGEGDSVQWGGRGGNKRKRTKKFKQNKRRKSARRLKRKN
jgi:hypothetical protein